MLDRRLEPLADRRRLAELAAQPAEEGDVSRFHGHIMLRYESARTIRSSKKMGGDGLEPPTPCL